MSLAHVKTIAQRVQSFIGTDDMVRRCVEGYLEERGKMISAKGVPNPDALNAALEVELFAQVFSELLINLTLDPK
jgi:hypothetical protein